MSQEFHSKQTHSGGLPSAEGSTLGVQGKPVVPSVNETSSGGSTPIVVDRNRSLRWSRVTEAVRYHSDCKEHVTPLGGQVCQSTTFVQSEVGSDPQFAYSRVGNPSVDQLENVLGRLENAPNAVSFSSGLAAETALFLTLLESGDHIVLSRAIYGGTTRLFNELFSRFGVTSSFVDSTSPLSVEDAINSQTKLIFLETPANPTLELSDIPAITQIAKRRGILVAVDNTFLTPVLQQPLDLGADISVYSTTKHIEGHSVALGGAIVSRHESFLDRLRRVRKSVGSIQTPKNAWLTTRGIKTLPLRIERHSQSALIVARWLHSHPEVISVNYPGLEHHPQHKLAEQQHETLRGQTLHGGVLSFELTGGYERAVKFSSNVQLCNLVEHVGGIETLLTHPASMTHADVTEQQLANAGITRGLLRLSIGLEEDRDIIDDLEQAIARSSFSSDRSTSTHSLLRDECQVREAACPANN